MGHQWQKATCTEAKTCSVCGETEGNALGHKPGEEKQNFQVSEMRVYSVSEQYCVACGACVNNERTVCTSFTENGEFVLSPEDFLHIMSELAKTSFPDFNYSFVNVDGNLAAEIYWENEPVSGYAMYFYDIDHTMRKFQDANVAGELGSVVIATIGDPEDVGTLILLDKLWVFCKMLDPGLSEDDYKTIQSTKFVYALNEKTVGYYEQNGVAHKYAQGILEDGKSAVGVEQVYGFANLSLD